MSTVSFGAAGAGGRRTSRWPGMAVFFVIGVVFAVAGAAVLGGLPWQQARTHLAARSWPVADATILAVSLAEQRRPGPSGVEAELVLTVAYAFEVEGRVVEGHRAGLSDRAQPHDRDLMTLYRKLNFARLTGRTVPVSYDPADPAHAFLDIGFSWTPAALRAGLGLGAILIGVSLAAGGVRGRERTSSL